MWAEVHVLFLTTPHPPQHAQAHDSAGDYIIIVRVLYIKLGGEACCLLPVDLTYLLLSLHSQSDPLATEFFCPAICCLLFIFLLFSSPTCQLHSFFFFFSHLCVAISASSAVKLP